MTAQGIERIPDSLGYLVINDDGAVLSVCSDNFVPSVTSAICIQAEASRLQSKTLLNYKTVYHNKLFCSITFLCNIFTS